MPMPFVVSSPRYKHLGIEASWLISQIREQWPDAEVTIPGADDGPNVFGWKMSFDGPDFTCAFSREEDSLWMEGGDISDYAKIVVWFRKLIPSRRRLILSCTEEPDELSITAETTEADIMSFFS
jgi:hypothetical protein